MGRRTKGPQKIMRRQLNLRVDARLYAALEALARDEQRSVAQVAKRLVDEGLGHRLNGPTTRDDTSGAAIAPLAASGDAFTWLAAEPDLYDDRSGEPL
jgi:hypothetical protein